MGAHRLQVPETFLMTFWQNRPGGLSKGCQLKSCVQWLPATLDLIAAKSLRAQELEYGRKAEAVAVGV